MKLWDIAKTIGSAAIQVALPGTGSLIVGAVNELLPDDKKLPAGATGDDINRAISSLPPEQQASLMEKEFEVDLTWIKESHSTVRTMLESETKNPHTTRPYVVKHAFHIVAYAMFVAITAWGYAVVAGKTEIIKAIMNGWPFVLAVVTPFVTMLHGYFGILRREHKNRLDAANGSAAPSGIAGLLTSVFNRK